MKRNFVVSLFGSFVGLGMLLILLGSIGIVSARGADARSNATRTNEVDASTPLTSTFTYQGQLKNGGNPITATCDFQFGLWDSLSGGAQLGITQTLTAVSVNAGYFTALINSGTPFGVNAFNGNQRWLAIAVRCPSGGGSYAAFNQRQQLTTAPYALALPGLRTQPNATSPNIIGGYSGNFISPTVVGGTIGGGGVSGDVNKVSRDFGTIGGGASNTASGYNATIAGGYNNTADGNYAAISGGSTNTASAYDATIGGGYNNTASGYGATIGGGVFNIASDWYAMVTGGYSNTASGWSATISGGSSNTASGYLSTVAGGYTNTANYTYTVVGGGYHNTANGTAATIGGGRNDTANGTIATVSGGDNNTANDHGDTIGGGSYNTASNFWATVGGGEGNTASGYIATVSGGDSNIASGADSMIPGGYANIATGDYSFAAGHKAHANYAGDFVWSDSSGVSTDSSAVDQFVAHASNGFYFYPTSGGCTLATGAGGWSCSSDRNLKENFKAVDSQAVLQSLSRIPVLRWNSVGQNMAIQHVGPMAQDFYAAFGLGEDNLHINTVDAQGIALVAIKGLYQENQDLKAQNADLAARVSKLEQNTTTGNALAQTEPFNVSTLLSVIAFAGFAIMWIQQRRSKRGQA